MALRLIYSGHASQGTVSLRGLQTAGGPRADVFAVGERGAERCRRGGGRAFHARQSTGDALAEGVGRERPARVGAAVFKRGDQAPGGFSRRADTAEGFGGVAADPFGVVGQGLRQRPRGRCGGGADIAEGSGRSGAHRPVGGGQGLLQGGHRGGGGRGEPVGGVELAGVGEVAAVEIALPALGRLAAQGVDQGIDSLLGAQCIGGVEPLGLVFAVPGGVDQGEADSTPATLPEIDKCILHALHYVRHNVQRA